MSANSKTPEQLNGMAHRHYQLWFVGTGAQVEFFLTKTVLRLDDIMVFVDGVLQRPDLTGTVRDYKIRGITPGYTGDSNAIKFAVAPLAAIDINVCVVSS